MAGLPVVADGAISAGCAGDALALLPAGRSVEERNGTTA